MRVANWVTGSSRSAIRGPSPVREYRKAFSSPAGARTTRGVLLHVHSTPGCSANGQRVGSRRPEHAERVAQGFGTPLARFVFAVTRGWRRYMSVKSPYSRSRHVD